MMDQGWAAVTGVMAKEGTQRAPEGPRGPPPGCGWSGRTPQLISPRRAEDHGVQGELSRSRRLLMSVMEVHLWQGLSGAAWTASSRGTSNGGKTPSGGSQQRPPLWTAGSANLGKEPGGF